MTAATSSMTGISLEGSGGFLDGAIGKAPLAFHAQPAPERIDHAEDQHVLQVPEMPRVEHVIPAGDVSPKRTPRQEHQGAEREDRHPRRTARLRMNAPKPWRSYAPTMKYPEIMKKRLMKKERFTMKKGPRIGARTASCTGQ